MIRVLIVEDKPESLYLLRALLEGNGCAVDEARHGAEALVRARQAPPNLVVSDLLMPVMDGYTLLRHWKSDERLRDIPFVVYTATYTESQDEKLAYELGADGFILKPAEPSEFMARLRDVLDRAAHGALPAQRPAKLAEELVLAEYSRALIRKLEEKAFQLQDANRAMEADLVRLRQAETAVAQANAELQRIVDEQRNTAEALRREQALFQGLADTIPDHIYFKDRQSRLMRINGAMARKFGLRDPAEAVGKTDFDFFREEHARQAYDDEQRMMASGEPLVGVEEKETWPDGRVTWVSTTKVPLKNAAGEITGMVGISRDITDQKLAAERLQEQATMLDRASDAIYVKATSGTILYWNRAAERIYGWSAAEAVGRDAAGLIMGRDEAAGNLTARVVQEGEWSGERTQTTKTGHVDVFSRLTLLRDDQGRPRSILAINTDITEKKQLEARFLRAQRLESLGALASGIAHDLNNVLAPIVMGAPLLRESVHDSAARNLLATMETSAQRGAAIVRQVLTFARGSEGRRVPLQPKHLIREIVLIAEQTFPKNIEIRDDSTAEVALIEGDATQLHQALLNLCVNARDAMPTGGTLILAAENVAVSGDSAAQIPGASAGAFVRIRVSDTGIGIPREVQDRIFEPFFTTKGLGKGTGLGLSTVLGITKGHGGFVRLESRVGHGTDFELFLPTARESQVPETRSAAPAIPRAHGEGVLLVDDEAAVREVVHRTLEEFGYRVTACESGAEAVARFRVSHGEIQLVVTDIMMPEMDGPTLVQALRAIEPGVRIIGITGISDVATMQRMETLKIGAVVAKPFTIDELLAAVHQALAPDSAAPPAG